METSPRGEANLCLGRRGTVGGAVALALAAVLAGILTTALAFAIVLAFAGMLGRVVHRVGREQDARLR